MRPTNMVAELIHGALHLHPRPALPHARTSSVLGIELGGPFDRGRGGPGGWVILDEPELHLGPDVVVPDLAGWRRERMPSLPKGAWTELAPDWVCEVLSPGTRRLDLTDKRDIYGAAGVGHLWLVDPEGRTLEAFALRDGAWVLIAALAATPRCGSRPSTPLRSRSRRSGPTDALRAKLRPMNEHLPHVRPATYQDVLDAPENMVAELIRGALSPAPAAGAAACAAPLRRSQ